MTLLFAPACALTVFLAMAVAAVPGVAAAGRVEPAAPSPAAASPAADVAKQPDEPAELPPAAAEDIPPELAVPKEVTKEKMNTLATELRRIANEHGPDSVVLQAKLMMRSISAGAIAPTEVRVAGPSTRLGNDYLAIEVDTGLIFAEPETSANSRTDTIWREIAGPVLEDMGSFNFDPDGLELVFVFGVQRTSDTVSVARPVRYETLSIAVPGDKLAAAAVENLDSQTLRAHAHFGELSATETKPK